MADRENTDAARAGSPPLAPPVLRRVELESLAFRIQVPALAVHVASIRRAVGASAEAHGIPPEVRMDIALAVSEACANVVTHAYRGAAEPGLLIVETHPGSQEFVIVVSDEGTGITPRTDSPGLGQGLALIARVTQRLEIATNGYGGAKLTMAFAAG